MIMKKKYMIPTTVVIKLQTVSMLADSGGGVSGNNSTPGNSYSSTDVSYGRFFDFGDDEDEE